MEIVRRTARLLASVTSETEALLCAHLAADIIDAKNPAAGALGALPHATVKAIRARVPRHVPVSATIGDPIDDADATARAVVAMAATGVDIVKVGLNSGAGTADNLSALARLDLAGVLLVGVLLADRGVDLDLVKRARDAGFAGLMLDTADKKRGALPDVVPSCNAASVRRGNARRQHVRRPRRIAARRPCRRSPGILSGRAGFPWRALPPRRSHRHSRSRRRARRTPRGSVLR